MKKIVVSVVLLFVLAAFVPYVFSQSSQDSDVSVSVDRKCLTNSYDFEFSAANVSEDGIPLIGTGGSGYFTYSPTNRGEMSHVSENISIYRLESGNLTNMNVNNSLQPGTYNSTYLLNSTNLDGYRNDSRLLEPDDRALNLTYWYGQNYTGWPEYPPRLKAQEFVAIGNSTANKSYISGLYRADLELENSCEFIGNQDTEVIDGGSGESYNLGQLNGTIDGRESTNLTVDGLNVSFIDGGDNYVRTSRQMSTYTTYFRIVDVPGNGSTPTNISGEKDLGTELETDADEVSNFTKNSTLNDDVNDTQNSSTQVDTDVDEQVTDADPVEGDADAAGQTPEPEPEPEPEPDPQPLVSLSIKPMNSTYEAPRGRFTEVGLQIENIGEEAANNVQLEPRLSENMNWQTQTGNINTLQVGDSVNRSVYVNPGESVDPGIYQIPVYASNAEADIAIQYVNVEVKEQIFQGVLNVEEAPRDVTFEREGNYTLPLILSNGGETPIQNVSVELENMESCGEYSVDPIDDIEPGSDVSATVQFTAGSNIQECSGTLIASSNSGDLAFSDINIDVQEEVGPIPEEFRVPIVASLWTLMLLAYAVLTKKYGVHNMTVKVPLVLLVVGEAFIIIYLSSAYYNLVPPGLLPF